MANPGDIVAYCGVAAPQGLLVLLMGVVRGRRRLWLAGLPVLIAGTVTLHRWPSQPATSSLTALGCLNVGAALVRLTPPT